MKKVFASVFVLFSIVFNIFGYILPIEWFTESGNYATVLFWLTFTAFVFYVIAYYGRYHNSETLVPKFSDCEWKDYFIVILKVLWGTVIAFTCLQVVECIGEICDSNNGYNPIRAVKAFNCLMFSIYFIHYVIYSTVLETREVK